MGTVQTPDAPGFDVVWWKDADRTTTYRNYLLTLKWQLLCSYLSASPHVATIDRMLSQPTITQAELQALITTVRTLAPGQPAPPQHIDPLSSAELPEFERRIDRAGVLVATAELSAAAIAAAFGTGAATPATAVANLGKIKLHLASWKKHQATRVSVNRSPNAGYAAFNLGQGDASKLTLAADFFTKHPDVSAATLIHEASHGIAETTDLAYTDTPYFLSLRDELALTNADNYLYGAELASNLRPPIVPGAAVAQTPVQNFKQALSLCSYKCAKVWMVLMYLRDRYQGVQRDLHDDTVSVHEAMMQLGASTQQPSYYGNDLRQIALQRTLMLIEIMDYARRYGQTAKTFTEANGVVTATPVNDPSWQEIDFDVTGATTIDDVAQRIFLGLMLAVPFTAAQANQLRTWAEAMFANMMSDLAHQKMYHVSTTDLQLRQLLST
jgi:hypothetical protein